MGRIRLRNNNTQVDRLLEARAAIDDALRREKGAVTVLFTDVVGSTEYFDRYGDTAGFAMLHRHAELGKGAVTDSGGRVVKTIGDSVMAEFAEPAAAVCAAIAMQRRLKGLNDTLPERERLQLRVGINSGHCYRQGDDLYGDAVNVAARITKRTGPAQILVSHSVRESLPADLARGCNSLGQVAMKGKAEKEEVFEIVWTDPDSYDGMRRHLTTALSRGELTSPRTAA